MTVRGGDQAREPGNGRGGNSRLGVRCTRRRLLLIVLPVLVLVPVGAVFYDFEVQRNFAEVVPGKIYRSGQPGEAQLERWVRTYGLKSILDLRHSVPEYQRAITDAYGVRLHQVSFSARRGLSEEQWLEMREILTSEENLPILVHCRGGSDRTGLVTALYRVEVQGWPLEEALRGMRRRYHFPARYPRLHEQLRERYGDGNTPGSSP